MKRGLAGLLLLAAAQACSIEHNVQKPYDPTQAEAEIREIERSWAQVAVTGDPSVCEQIFADDFVGVAPDGTQYTKQAFIDDTKAHPLGFTANELDAMKVRFEGDVAVAQGQETFTRKDGAKGRFVWTDVLVRRGGKWRIVAAQDAMVPGTGQASGAGLFAGPEREGIDRTRNAYVAAWLAADAARVADLYTENAVILYPNQPAIQGKPAILAYFKAFFGEFGQNEFQLTSSEIEVVGSWAFDRGSVRWKGTPSAGGKPVEDIGKYLVVLQQQPGGEWKVARDMDNSDRPATQSTRGTP
jgi:uncharacterized protein (TIGR02246 family)